MSYDLMVFEPLVPPRDRAGFMAWYREQTNWSEGHDYNDPANTSSALRAWFMEMTKSFPAMNGPYASKDYDNTRLSDYSNGRSIIYVAFAWSEAEAAYRTAFNLAKKHKLGFYDVSSDEGKVWMPARSGDYVCVHEDDPAQTPRPAARFIGFAIKGGDPSDLPSEVLGLLRKMGMMPDDK